MAPAAAILTRLSSLAARFLRAAAACLCTPGELREPSRATKGGMAPAANIFFTLLTLSER